MMAGFFWLNAFSVLIYDHEAALISAVASSMLFLSLMIRSPGWTFPFSHRPLDRIPEGILGFAAVILVVCACDGFRLVGLEGMAKYRDELVHSRLIEYAIGNINGALIPFAFACFLPVGVGLCWRRSLWYLCSTTR